MESPPLHLLPTHTTTTTINWYLIDFSFQGELEVSSVTGRLEPFYPIWKRNLFRYFVTLPVVILCLCIVFAVMLANFYIEELITKLVDIGEYAFIAKVFPKVCHAVSIFTLDRMYTRVAYWLNDMGKFGSSVPVFLILEIYYYISIKLSIINWSTTYLNY